MLIHKSRFDPRPELICSKSRQKQYSEARSLFSWLAVEEVGHSAAEVARFLGISRMGVHKAAIRGFWIKTRLCTVGMISLQSSQRPPWLAKKLCNPLKLVAAWPWRRRIRVKKMFFFAARRLKVNPCQLVGSSCGVDLWGRSSQSEAPSLALAKTDPWNPPAQLNVCNTSGEDLTGVSKKIARIPCSLCITFKTENLKSIIAFQRPPWLSF